MKRPNIFKAQKLNMLLLVQTVYAKENKSVFYGLKY